MNRAERRKRDAELRKLDSAPLPTARADGRPQYYIHDQMVDPLDPTHMDECYVCKQNGLRNVRHSYGHFMLADPANNPSGSPDLYEYICRGHLPDNAVIFDPRTGDLEDKGGSHKWREDPEFDA